MKNGGRGGLGLVEEAAVKIEAVNILGDVADFEVWGEGDSSGGGWNCAEDDAEKSGFASAITTGDLAVFARIDFEVEILEKWAVGIDLCEVVDGKEATAPRRSDTDGGMVSFAFFGLGDLVEFCEASVGSFDELTGGGFGLIAVRVEKQAVFVSEFIVRAVGGGSAVFCLADLRFEVRFELLGLAVLLELLGFELVLSCEMVRVISGIEVELLILNYKDILCDLVDKAAVVASKKQ